MWLGFESESVGYLCLKHSKHVFLQLVSAFQEVTNSQGNKDLEQNATVVLRSLLHCCHQRRIEQGPVWVTVQSKDYWPNQREG